MSGVLLYVQHLLGVGHVKRSASLVRALNKAHIPVTVVLGGVPVPHANFGEAEVIYLPSARAKDESFKVLLDEHDCPIDDVWRETRRLRLMEIAETVNPDVLFIELFPFGRRQFRFELIPLLEAFQERAKIICSARDVIVGKALAKRNDEIVETLHNYFDEVLVHGVEDVIALEATFPYADKIADMLTYTGYAIEHAEDTGSSDVGQNEIIISVGGGAVGADLLAAIVRARPYSALKDKRWRMIAGDDLPAKTYAEIESQCDTNFTLERARSDFIYVLRNCALSISLGGYNTVMDVMSAKCRNLIVPFSGGVETEQLFRARAFANRGWVQIFDGDLLNGPTFAQAIDEAALRPLPDGPGLDINGASNTAQLISRML